MREERGFLPRVPTEGRALTKRAPQMGGSHCYQLRPRNGHETLMLLLLPPRSLCASTGNYPHTHPWEPVCEHRSLSTPPLPGACAACHCQGPMIHGQLPWENTHHTSGCCNIMPVSAAAGSTCIPIMTTLPPPSLSEQEHPNQPML